MNCLRNGHGIVIEMAIYLEMKICNLMAVISIRCESKSDTEANKCILHTGIC